MFAFLDDHRQLAAHMAKSSPMMGGGSMTLETDDRDGRAFGSHIRMSGRVLGPVLALDEGVDVRKPPLRRSWHTVGMPRLVVIGHYRMGFDLAPRGAATPRLRLWIDDDLPASLPGRIAGTLFAGFHARWCIAQVLAPCLQRFGRAA